MFWLNVNSRNTCATTLLPWQVGVVCEQDIDSLRLYCDGYPLRCRNSETG